MQAGAFSQDAVCDVHRETDWRPLLETWRNVALGSTRMHCDAQRRFSRGHRWLGGLATFFTTLVGATIVKEIGGQNLRNQPIDF